MLLLLPLLLAETCVAVSPTSGSGKRVMWKPSLPETMAHFVDVQKVSF